MNSQKKIEVNQSSLLSLKAELLRKKQEVHDAKLSEFPNRPTEVIKLKTKLDKANEGVSERSKKDVEELEEDKDNLRKSQKILEAKSKLYDELSKNPQKGDGSCHFLVDFKSKEKMEKYMREEEEVEEEEEDKIESDYEEDEEEWVDFVDCLGRTKRCHRDDLESMKSNDENLRRSLFGNKQDEGRKEPEAAKEMPQLEGEPALCSEDMRREMLRRKWEEEERKLLDRKDIHYQHVLFDEARNHGVGYYNFSTDESERSRQLDELNKLRKETVDQQASTREAAARKKKQMQERLRAARRRKRERLGLPPLEDGQEDDANEGGEEEGKAEKPEELKREEQHPTSIRPWDIGKDNVSKVLTQSEWIEKRRQERPQEFAPPTHEDNLPRRKKRKPEMTETKPETESTRRGLGAEIPPPQSLESTTSCHVNRPDIEKSIEEGLNFIRKQLEEKESQKTKGIVEFF